MAKEVEAVPLHAFVQVDDTNNCHRCVLPKGNRVHITKRRTA